jgi:hypothetical protein
LVKVLVEQDPPRNALVSIEVLGHRSNQVQLPTVTEIPHIRKTQRIGSQYVLDGYGFGSDRSAVTVYESGEARPPSAIQNVAPNQILVAQEPVQNVEVEVQGAGFGFAESCQGEQEPGFLDFLTPSDIQFSCSSDADCATSFECAGGICVPAGGSFTMYSAGSEACTNRGFTGRTLKSGWSFESWSVTENSRPTRRMSFQQKPSKGSRDLSYELRVTAGDSGRVTLNQLVLRGPPNASWQDAFRP